MDGIDDNSGCRKKIRQSTLERCDAYVATDRS